MSCFGVILLFGFRIYGLVMFNFVISCFSLFLLSCDSSNLLPCLMYVIYWVLWPFYILYIWFWYILIIYFLFSWLNFVYCDYLIVFSSVTCNSFTAKHLIWSAADVLFMVFIWLLFLFYSIYILFLDFFFFRFLFFCLYYCWTLLLV